MRSIAGERFHLLLTEDHMQRCVPILQRGVHIGSIANQELYQGSVAFTDGQVESRVAFV
jgi:hypothetical protein